MAKKKVSAKKPKSDRLDNTLRRKKGESQLANYARSRSIWRAVGYAAGDRADSGHSHTANVRNASIYASQRAKAKAAADKRMLLRAEKNARTGGRPPARKKKQ